MDKTTTIKAYAKINLYLDITARRNDGYHELRGVMQQISLHDTLEVSIGGGLGFEYSLEIEYEGSPYNGAAYNGEPCNGAAYEDTAGGGADSQTVRPVAASPLSTGADNLCVRAASEFARAAGMENVAVGIKLTKRIPAAAGLGGGSTDAAAVLTALNELCRTPFSKDELCVIGERIGADVPFCVIGGACEIAGTGTRLTPCEPLPDCTILVAAAQSGISTPRAYALLDEKFRGFYRREPAAGYDSFIRAISARDLGGICCGMYNIFEEIVLPAREDVAEIKRIIAANGAAGVLLSGSGPSVFGIFESGRGNAEEAMRQIKKTGAAAFLCESLSTAR